MLSKGFRGLSCGQCLNRDYWANMLTEYDFHMIGRMILGVEARYAEDSLLYFAPGTQFCSINDIVSWYNLDIKCWR